MALPFVLAVIAHKEDNQKQDVGGFAQNTANGEDENVMHHPKRRNQIKRCALGEENISFPEYICAAELRHNGNHRGKPRTSEGKDDKIEQRDNR